MTCPIAPHMPALDRRGLKHTLILASARLGMCAMLGAICLSPAYANEDELERDNLAKIGLAPFPRTV